MNARCSVRCEDPLREGLIFEKKILKERAEVSILMDDGDLGNPPVGMQRIRDVGDRTVVVRRVREVGQPVTRAVGVQLSAQLPRRP